MSVEVACPGCGAPIVFRLGSATVTVCQYCHSVVARGDRKIEDLGKIAYLADTDSALAVGLKGTYQGGSFEVLGAARLGHEAGGVWDEWYLSFDDGRWGWLAEAQGRFYITFAVPVKGREKLPAYEALPLGERIRLRQGEPPMVVAEKGIARPIGAKGEIPYRLVPNQDYQYADLSGPGGRFATLDYSDVPPSVYLGCEIPLDDLHLPHTPEAVEHEPRQVEGVHLTCPKCGGSLELRAPDKTERVGCPFCGALLDASQGQLRLLHTLDGPLKKLPLAIGTTGKLGGVEYTVIGFLMRGVKFDVWYYWHEYLLYNPQLGFRWLECSDHHWNFIEPLPPGTVQMDGKSPVFAGRRFRWFQQATAEVKMVLGEFYWKVAVGEKVTVSDFVRPPEALSREITIVGKGSGEVSWSRATYLPVHEVEQAFGLKNPLPRPSTVGPNEPFPYKGIYPYWAVFLALAILLGITIFGMGHGRKVFEETYTVPALASNGDEGHECFGGPFELRDRENVEIMAAVPATNFSLEIDGDLIDEETGVVQAFTLPVEYYAGVEDGEAWSEGSHESYAYVSALPAGKCWLRMEVHGGTEPPSGTGVVQPEMAPPPSPQAASQTKAAPLSLHVRVRQDVRRLRYWLLAMLGVSVVPFCIALYHASFESRRWRDSNVKDGGA
jgi:hypothetical protein